MMTTTQPRRQRKQWRHTGSPQRRRLHIKKLTGDDLRAFNTLRERLGDIRSAPGK